MPEATAAPADPDLRRGVNVYLRPRILNGQLRDLGEGFHRFTPEDAARLRELGLTHIRLAVAPDAFLQGTDVPADFKHGLAPAYLREIHAIIQRALNEGLSVVLAVMAEDDIWGRLADDTEYAAQWERFFRLWAEEFHHYAPERLVLETLNEPRLERFKANPRADGRPRMGMEWPALQVRLLHALRSVLPRHQLVVVGEGMSSAEALMRLPQQKDPHLIYALHDYDPYLFTHQGADWTMLGNVRNVRYPTPHNPCRLQRHSVPAEHQASFEEYCRQDWNAEQAQFRARRIAAWARKQGVRVWLSEFGAYPLHSSAQDVRQYLHDVRQAYENEGIGWCAWEYANWLRRLEDSGTRDALGLAP